MTQHTPGPWDALLVFNSAQDTVGIEIYQDDGNHIPCRNGDPESEANARLIAAAPELLEMAEALRTDIVSTMKTTTDEGLKVGLSAWLALLNSRIAKATQ